MSEWNGSYSESILSPCNISLLAILIGKRVRKKKKTLTIPCLSEQENRRVTFYSLISLERPRGNVPPQTNMMDHEQSSFFASSKAQNERAHNNGTRFILD